MNRRIESNESSADLIFNLKKNTALLFYYIRLVTDCTLHKQTMVSLQFLLLVFVAFFLMVGLKPQAAFALSSTDHPQRIALVTGSNKGIGIEIVRKLGSEKKKKNNSSDNAFFCILGCRNEDLGRAAVEKLKSEGIMDIEFIRIDLQDLDSIKNAVQQIEETYGRCDFLVNNAAVCYNDPTLYGTTSHTPFADQAEITVKTNFFGTLALTKAILPLMEKSSDSPRIINIASSAGRLSILPSQDRRDVFSSDKLRMEDLESYMVDFIQAAKRGTHKKEGWPNTGYGVSKVGIIAMTKILARDNKNNKFMVNSIDPGYCSTDQNNNQGFISAERGAITPYLLATIEPERYVTGMHWYQEKEIEW